jgi:hypothetical protein
MLYLYMHDTLLEVVVLNTISNNVSGITYNMVSSFIGVEHHFQQYVSYNV